MTARLVRVLAGIDAANAADPRRAPDGRPFEQDHAERLSAWIERLVPAPPDPLRIAARGQHIERWTRPRDQYPGDRGGYLRWREDLKGFHARRVGEIMKAAGYSVDDIARAEALIAKRALRDGDPEGQALEDGLCLVFLETQLNELRQKTTEDKMRTILTKTWKKMSAAGRREALGLSLSDESRAFLLSALSPDATPSL